MKKANIIGGILAITMLTSLSFGIGYSRLTCILGEVFIQKAEDHGFEEGTIDFFLEENQRLGTRYGRTELNFGKINYLRLDNYSLVELEKLPRRGDDRIILHLLSGVIFLRINFMEYPKDIEVHTTDASFYIMEEGLYRFELLENCQTELKVFFGTVETVGEENSGLIGTDEMLVAASGYITTRPQPFYQSYEDGFAEWNRKLDEIFSLKY
jgi:hypothetical protein